MNVFYFTSDLFASVAATSIVSLLENNKTANEINFYMYKMSRPNVQKILYKNV